MSKHGAACVTCRRRGRKCDTTLPSCQACSSRGISCEGYVWRWSVSVSSSLPPAKSARFPPLITRKSRRAPKSAESYAIKRGHDHCGQSGAGGGAAIPVEHVPIYDEFSHEDIDSAAALTLLHTETQDHDIDASSIPDGLGDLVNYDARELGSTFFLETNPSANPYMTLILPMAVTVAPVRFAIAASTSCHLATRLNDHSLEKQSLRLQVQATNLLRKRLQLSDPTDAPGSLVAMLLLAQLDMCRGHCTELDFHIRAARDMIKSQVNELSPRRFVEHRLIWLDIMTSTTSAREPVFTLEDVRQYLVLFSSEMAAEWSFQCFPCPVFLFETIASATFLYGSHFNHERSTDDIRQGLLNHKRAVLKWATPPQKNEYKFHLAEAYRSGTILFLNGLLKYTSDATETQSLISSLMRHAKALPEATGWSYLLSWPLYQVGLDAQNDEETKTWIRNHLRSSVVSSGCRHGLNALSALESVWRHGRHHSRTSIRSGTIEGYLVLV